MNTVITNSLCTAFERQLYAAAHRNLEDGGNPLRVNNFAYAMRELVRHLLERLAPDESVTRCSWYVNKTNKTNGITRRQRAYYAVQGGLSDNYVLQTLNLETGEMHSALVGAVDSLSKFTHIGPKVFDVGASEAVDLIANIEDAVAALLETIQELHAEITSALIDEIDQAVVNESISETLVAIDEIATHHSIDEVYINDVNITKIDHERVFLQATGSIGAMLQWGSNSDVSKDEGAVMRDSFPFECDLVSPVGDPKELEISSDGLRVDNSSWYGRYGEDEA